MLPVGVIVDALSVVIGGFVGSLLKNRLSTVFKDRLNLVFGACSMAIGIQSILRMEYMPAVIFAVTVGTAIGSALRLGEHIAAGAQFMQNGISRFVPVQDQSGETFTAALVTATVLFCASGTGIYGSIISGMTGDQSVLIAKAVLDLFTALIFACSLGPVVSVIAVPQCVIFLVLFFCARFIYPLTTPAMIDDFRGCGGIIMLTTGFRIAGLKQFPIADMLPAMILIMPFSWIWSSFILPLVG